MRICEVSQDVGIDKFVVALRNHIGRAASQKVPSKLNWEAIGQMSRANGFEFAADYETFKSMYDTYPIIQGLVKNFNSQGIVLNVPGVSDRNQQQASPKKDSQAEVDKIAASNAEANLGDSVNNANPVLAESSNIPQKGSQIKLQWSQEGNDTGVVTGVGADYIKVKLANDKSPHPDTCVIYFDEFAKYKVTPFEPNQKVSEISADLKQRYKEKSAKVIKDTKPFTKKGEYKDIAKKLVSRRQAGLDKVSNDPIDETYFGREIYFIRFTSKPATSINNIMRNMKKKLVSFEVVDARAATGGEFGNNENEQAFSVDQADGAKIDKWINKTNYVELLDNFDNNKHIL